MKYERYLQAIAVLFIFFFSCSGAIAMVVEVSLSSLAQGSECIATGTVSEVKSVAGVKIARIDLADIVKGCPKDSRSVYFLAQPSWTCDISTAVEQEKGLFFLTPCDIQHVI